MNKSTLCFCKFYGKLNYAVTIIIDMHTIVKLLTPLYPTAQSFG